MGGDEGFLSHSSNNSSDASKLTEAAAMNITEEQEQEQTSLSSPDRVSSRISQQESPSLSPDDHASKVTQEQVQETKSDDDSKESSPSPSTMITSIKLFGIVIETTISKNNKDETTSTEVMINDGNSGNTTTSTSRNGKEIQVSTSVITNECRSSSCSKKRKFQSSAMEMNGGCRVLGEPGRILKKLTKSNTDHSSRFLIGRCIVEEFVLPYLTETQKAMARTVQGCNVQVRDDDTGEVFGMMLKQWKTGSFALTTGWIKKFVHRRNLRIDDVIELFWDARTSMFQFKVVERTDWEVSSSKVDEGGKKNY